MLETKNLLIESRRTSIRLEPELWKCLKEIAESQSLSLQEVCTAIHHGHSSSSYTAAVRVFVLMHYWTQAMMGQAHNLIGPLRDRAGTVRTDRFVSTYTEDGEDFDRRTLWHDHLLHRAPETGMFRAYWQWRARCQTLGRVPTYDEMLTGPFEDELQRGTVNVIDATSENPEGYRLTHLSATSRRLGAFARHAAIGEIAFKLHAQSLARELREIKSSLAPQVVSISQRRHGVNRAYVRLGLPLAGQDGRVRRVATIVRGLRTTPSIFNEKLFGLDLHRLARVKP